ncbi:Bcr/CflA family efflux MFS transporter [Nakamurella endophytica]|uniref:Major facilitator superfamily (MFS) profile domain-containing protein n=1 Tax=Nakamurella endophytica TaxID=1748367 RepID=A0A917SYL0_9ACTN|nr:Bcr/CflA family efflux MFS transporter [Nakamurella endophytica]GGM02809.1 hypothetical protein GCM10011594_23650 [Nakamurella endophytica]
MSPGRGAGGHPGTGAGARPLAGRDGRGGSGGGIRGTGTSGTGGTLTQVPVAGPAGDAAAAGQAVADAPRTTAAPGTGLLLALGALSAFGPLCLDMYLPALPDLAASLHSTASAAQLSLSACIVGLALGQLLVGPLSDRWGRRGPLLVGVAVFVVASAACAVTPTMWLFVVLRLLQGASGAAGIVLGRAIVADHWTGRAAAGAYALMAAVNGFSPVLAPVIGGQVLRVGDWRTVFWVLAGIGVALLLLVVLAVPESLPPGRRSTGRLSTSFAGFAVVMRDPVYLGWVASGTLVAGAMFGYISASPFLLQDGFGLSPQLFSICFAINAVGIAATSQLGRVLVRRRRPATLLTASAVQCLAGALLLAASLLVGWGLWPVLVGLFVMVSALGLGMPSASALSMDRHRTVAGSAAAVFGAAQFALAAVAAALVGIGNRAAGSALAVTALTCAVLALATVLVTRRAAGREHAAG